MTNNINCPKCNMKINTKTELESHTDELVQDEHFDKILEINSQNWESEVLQSKMLVLVEFWHASCQSCKEFNPIFIQVAKEKKNQLKFVKFNVLSNAENRELAIKYGLTSTPTLIFFCNGKPIATKVERDGFETKERLSQLINKMKNECSHKIREGSKKK